MKGPFFERIIIITLFAVAMGFLESAVVVYLRELYYPEGFSFPLTNLADHILITELFREIATMVMLVTVSMLAARKWNIRFAWFIYMFAIWDIFYYIFLWLLIGWPESLLTWDILFMIPTTWVGPVIAPVINSLTMILLASLILLADRWTSGRADQRTSTSAKATADKSVQVWGSGLRAQGSAVLVRLSGLEWGLLIIGSLITITAYIEDYSVYMLDRLTLTEWLGGDHQAEVMSYATTYIPVSFNWILFSAGTTLFFIVIGLFLRRLFIASRKNLPQ